jgi:hypothetical protein
VIVDEHLPLTTAQTIKPFLARLSPAWDKMWREDHAGNDPILLPALFYIGLILPALLHAIASGRGICLSLLLAAVIAKLVSGPTSYWSLGARFPADAFRHGSTYCLQVRILMSWFTFLEMRASALGFFSNTDRAWIWLLHARSRSPFGTALLKLKYNRLKTRILLISLIWAVFSTFASLIQNVTNELHDAYRFWQRPVLEYRPKIQPNAPSLI